MSNPHGPPPDYNAYANNPQYIGPGYSNPAMAPTGYSDPAMASAGYSNPAMGYSDPAMASAGYSNPAMAPTGYSDPAMAPMGYGNPAMAPKGYSDPAMASAGYSNPAMTPTDDGTSHSASNNTGVETLEQSSPTFGNSFSNKAIRRAFIRKVYLILMAQLLLTVGIICLCVFVDAIRIWIQTNLWVYLTAYGIFLCVYIVLVCIKSVRRKYPGNIICLIVLTLSMSLVLGTISSFHSTNIVLMSMAVTAVVCLSITIFAMQTKIDFTMCAGLMFTFFVVVIMFGFSIIITQYAMSRPIPILNNVYAALIALLYAWFLIFDTQLIMGGKKYELSPEEYIFGALALYIDIVDFFLLILSLFGGNSN